MAELDNDLEFQVEDIVNREGGTLKVAGRCCNGVISIGDTFEFIYLIEPIVEGTQYRELDSEKFPILVEVLSIECFRRPVEKIYSPETGLLEIKVLQEADMEITPKTVFRKNDRDRPAWDEEGQHGTSTPREQHGTSTP